MWQLYRENTLQFNFTYFMACSLLFILDSHLQRSLCGDGLRDDEDFHERTQIMAFAQFIGQLLGSLPLGSGSCCTIPSGLPIQM